MACAPSHQARPPVLWLLLGKPPQRSPVMPDVIARLKAEGSDVRVHVGRVDAPLPDRLADADAVVLRGVRRSTLMTVAELEAQGLRCCNSARSTLLTMDRGVVQQRLADAGLPVPSATTVPDADRARAWAAGHPVAVKVSKFDVGDGNGVARWDHPDTMQPPAAPGPYLVQHWVPSAGVDRKLYVIGTEVGGLLKPWSPARPMAPRCVRPAGSATRDRGRRRSGTAVADLWCRRRRRRRRPRGGRRQRLSQLQRPARCRDCHRGHPAHLRRGGHMMRFRGVTARMASDPPRREKARAAVGSRARHRTGTRDGAVRPPGGAP